jgi:hypothetical protein
LRNLILAEIRRLAAAKGGQPPGVNAFSNATGIAADKWRGVFWARWGDALSEAGFKPNSFNERRDTDGMLKQIAALARKLGRVPTKAEMQLHHRADLTFPAASTICTHFAGKADLIGALRGLAAQDGFADLIAILPAANELRSTSSEPSKHREGSVYLIKSGNHYKIGRSDQLERRVREVSIALPEKMTLVHSIRTDDPPGIEAYWHNRFKDQRANGEWFRLTAADVRAFTRRTFQ